MSGLQLLHRSLSTGALLLLLGPVGCQARRGSGTVQAPAAPSAPVALSYPVATAVYAVGEAITADLPTLSGGAATSYAISPALPAGLALDASTGAISGTPSAVSAATRYVVTATNAAGRTQASLTITVTAALEAPAGLTYSAMAPSLVAGTLMTPDTPASTGGAVATYTVAPALPDGLVLDAATGAITGTPTTVTGAAPYVVTATNAAGSTQATLTLTVTAALAAPAGLTYSAMAPSLAVGTLMTPDTPASTGGAVDTYTVAPALPSGLSMVPTTGVITGTPTTASAAAWFVVTATNAAGSTQATLTLAVSAALAAPAGLTYSAMAPSLAVGRLMTPDTPASTGGAVDTYAVAPALPAGLSLAAATGVITGTPTTASAAAPFVVTATNAAGSTQATLTLAVAAALVAPANLTYSAMAPTLTVGTPMTPDTPSSTGSTVDTFTVAPALPAGLSLSATTGAITGTPTTASAAAPYVVTATNAAGSTQATLTLAVAPLLAPANLSYSAPVATFAVGVPITPDTPYSTGSAVATYTVAPALPTGLSLAAATGAITGTPTTASPATPYVVTATNAAGSSPCQLTLQVVAPGPFHTLALLAGNPGGQGYLDGAAATACFDFPQQVAVDGSGVLFVADYNCIRRILPGGMVSTFALGGSNGNPSFEFLPALTVDALDNVYVVNGGTGLIHKLTPAGEVTTIPTLIPNPVALAVDAAGNLYVAGDAAICKVPPAGTPAIIAGTPGASGSQDGPGAQATFYNPNGLAVDAGGNLYVADTGNGTIRKIVPGGASYQVSTLAGTAGHAGAADGLGGAASFSSPWAVAVDGHGNLFVADYGTSDIRQITPEGAVTTLAGSGSAGDADGQGRAAAFNLPTGVAVDGSGNVYVADGLNAAIRLITPTGLVTTVAGADAPWGSADGSTGSSARFQNPRGVAVDTNGNTYVADTDNDTIRMITPAGVVTTLAGTPGAEGSDDGTGAAARFNTPTGVAVDGGGNVYVVDSGNHTIRTITPAGVVTTLAGTPGFSGSGDGTGAAARFYAPSGIALDGAGNAYVTDTRNNTIRKITPGGGVTTLAGQAGSSGSTDGAGNQARFNNPLGLAVDGSGNLYVADADNLTVRKVTPAGGVSTLAGAPGAAGYKDGLGNQASFGAIQGVGVDGGGNVYVTDRWRNTIRMITPAGLVTTVAGIPGLQGTLPGPLPAPVNTPAWIAFNPVTGGLVFSAQNAILQLK